MHELDRDLAHLQPLAVIHPAYRITQLGAGTGQQLHLATLRQFTDAREVVIVLVGVGGITDAKRLAASGLEVHVHVATHIEHERLARFLRAQQVGGVTEIFEVKLLEVHGTLLSFATETARRNRARSA